MRSACRKRWLELFALEHATLLPAVDVARDGDELVVEREPASGRPLDADGIAREHRAPLLLQAAAALAFFAAHGAQLLAEDFARAHWEIHGGRALLWLTRLPRASDPDDRAAVSNASTLEAVLLRLFAARRGRRVTHPAASRLLEQLRSPEARWRRPEFWVAGVFRAFPELASPAAATARERCLGVAGDALRSAAARALGWKARALAEERDPRVLRCEGSRLTPGGALGLALAGVRRARAASRRLREEAQRDGARAVWIAAAPEDWDEFSRRAFESAAISLPAGAEIVRVPRSLPAPASASEWRAALWVPCGTVAGSIRFYERFAQIAAAAPERGLETARQILSLPGWASFAGDPTGDAPWPEPPLESTRATPQRRARKTTAEDPGARVERLLREGRAADAVAEARRWVESSAEGEVESESWFPLSALLAPLPEAETAPWLQAIEAERELAGGRAADARARWSRVLRSPEAGEEERRRARLRLAEIAAVLESASEAARLAAAWRRDFPDAPPSEAVRALRLGAGGLAREGRSDAALALLEEADRAGEALPPADRVETALARARVFALAGRVADEEAVYDSIRPLALASGDAPAARLLAQEGRRLLDRREFSRAVLRFEEALAIERDDAGERAALLLDLAATLYHAGDTAGSERRLDECLAAAAAAGRDDLVRLARGNRIELLLNRCAWTEAAAEIRELEARARAENDEVRLLVALHHRGRLALRRGLLAAAAEDNARARELSSRLSDRLEIGELWVEEGDRRLYEGDRELARAAYEQAAAEPPDRSDRDGEARARLEELGWAEGGGPPQSARDALESLFAIDPYRAAETVARWRFALGEAGVAADLRVRADRALRAQGGDALADHAFGPPGPAVRRQDLRELREAVASAFRGDEPDGHRALRALGIAGLALREDGGRELARLGRAAEPGEESSRQRLEAGSARFELVLWPPRPPAEVEPIAWLLETLLFRGGPASPPSDFAQGWARLGIVTADASMEEPYRRLARFAAQAVTVLVLGPSGSGKEAIARAVHRLSPRAAGPFVAVNVPAIPAALLESELFGHVRGAFTGAERDRRGLLEEAAGGSIFFDEVGDLAPELQAKLLRALQEREFRRVGENRARPIDVRVVSATSRDLGERVEAGQFREDLFYRLHVAVLRLPPLRDRGRDALLLARHFLEAFARDYGRGRLTLAPEAAAAILAYPWPGNVRELQNAIAQAAALCDAGGCVGASLLPERVRQGSRPAEPASGDYRSRVDAHRRDLIEEALGRAGGNRTRAARQLGLSRQALHYLMRELQVGLPRAPS